MHTQPQWAVVERPLADGRFSVALQALTSAADYFQRLDLQKFDWLEVELLYHCGRTEAAVRRANASIAAHAEAAIPLARLTYILGMVAFDAGDLVESSRQIRKCQLLSETTGDRYLISRAQLATFRLSSDSLSGALPTIAAVRRAVASSGDVHQLVELRLQFAQASASRHSVRDARAHVLAAADLLRCSPNVWLQARVHLGLSVTDSLSGDAYSAMENAKISVALAGDSGCRRTLLGGRINLAHALQLLSEFELARAELRDVLREEPSDVSLRIAAIDCLANLFMGEGRLHEAADVPLRPRYVSWEAATCIRLTMG